MLEFISSQLCLMTMKPNIYFILSAVNGNELVQWVQFLASWRCVFYFWLMNFDLRWETIWVLFMISVVKYSFGTLSPQALVKIIKPVIESELETFCMHRHTCSVEIFIDNCFIKRQRLKLLLRIISWVNWALNRG